MKRFTMKLLCLFLLLSAACADFAVGQDPKKEKDKLPAPLPPAPILAERVEYLFRDGISKQPVLRLIGPEVGATASVGPQGLRLNIPAGRANAGEVGVEARVRLRGDFEITLEYEVLARPDPAPKLGAGAGLQVVLDTPDAFKARMGRSCRPNGTVFTANFIVLGPDGKEKFQGLTAPPANEKETRGHLRMVRAGKLLSYQIEEGGTGFRVIATKEVGLADVLAVQGLGSTGWQPVALEVRFPRLELRAGAMPDKAGAVEKVDVVGKVGAIDPVAPERVEYQFRDGIAKHPALRFIGPNAAVLAVVQPQGLRFNLPAGRENTAEVGVESRLRLRGDFEITLDYELAALPNPPPPLGAGAVLQIVLDTPDVRKGRMDRLHRPSDAVFGANAIINDDFRGLSAEPANPKETKGQLRMVRTGPVLSYQVQEGGPGFHEIASFEIGTGDVIAVQALCATGWQPVAAGIRFSRLELRSSKDGGAFPVEPASDLPIAQKSNGHSLLWIVIGLCVVSSLLAIGGIAAFLWKRGATIFAKTDMPVVAANKNAFMFACADCGKKLKGKPELAGKKIKCPQCGNMVLVKAVAQLR